ncbi:hypothetical protein [Coleofasciculus sp.]|uniref:hypothetical protein n=1 Tax=Coleofasciculus sp. TaxID=3100458 RepID=UPI003A387139
MAKNKKPRGVQQMRLHPDEETKAILEYLCEQSGKLYNMGVYFARQTFFKAGKLLTGKHALERSEGFDLIYSDGVFYLEASYELPKQETLVGIDDQALAIDLGTVDNLAACVDTLSNSFLIDARAMKAFNQYWNKQVSTSLPKFGEKPDGWKALLRRIKRGLYRSSDSSIVNADLNGSANILRKVARKLGIDLIRMGRRCLATVARVRLCPLPQSNLSAESPSL